MTTTSENSRCANHHQLQAFGAVCLGAAAEEWSLDMRAAVGEAVDAGVNLLGLFLVGRYGDSRWTRSAACFSQFNQH